MASKYVDMSSVVQVIGCVYNNPQLLDLTDKYVITDEDFADDFHRTIYGAIYKIYLLGAKTITLENISDYLASRPKSEALYKQQEGEKWLLRASEAAQLTSFDYYYNRLKKMSLLRAYDNYGVDVSSVYDPDLLDIKLKQYQEDYLDNSTLEEIADKIDSKIEEIRLKYVDGAFGEASQAGEGIEQLIYSLKERPEVGVPLYGNLINSVTRGARLRKFYLRSAATGLGKAIPNNTYIPTPIGKRMVGDIRPGDELFGPDGKPTKVLQIHPQPTKKEIWEITFADGRVAKCCGQHLWEYWDGKEYRVEDTETIYNRKLEPNTYGVRLSSPVEYPEQEYSISPYVWGMSVGLGIYGKFGFIPRKYLSGSAAQRLELLRGLMDTRGHVENNQVYFSGFFEERFRSDFLELCYSLGMAAKEVRENKILVYANSKTHKDIFSNITYDIKPIDYLNIVSIVKTTEQTDMTCFTVDNDSHLFLTNDYIVTHNTRSLIADACYIGCNSIYDEAFGWIRNGTAEPTLFIATEQDLAEVQTMMLAFLSNVNEEHILNGEYEGDEENRVLEAARIIQESPIYIEELSDFSLQDVENKIKQNIRDHDVKYVFDLI